MLANWFDSITQNRRIPMYKPIAEIAVNGNRLRKYSGQMIYLKDQTEFQIELQNSTQDVYKAKIKLNGKFISNAGIVLNPGQHFYLDRFIDTDEKLLFNTYDVPNTKAAKKAIEKNGLVEILFYKESTPVQPYYPIQTTLNDPWVTHVNGIGTGGAPQYGTVTCNNTMSFDTSNVKSSAENIFRSTKKGIETGRVEHGDKSDQDFTEVYLKFESICTASYTYHLLPTSAQVHTPKSIRSYCGGCGGRLRKGDQFCRHCGQRA